MLSSISDKLNAINSGRTSLSQLSYEVGLSCYRENAWVRACIDMLAESGSSIPWDVMQLASSDDQLMPTKSPALKDFLYAPSKSVPTKHFWKQVIMNLYVGGNCFVRKIRVSSIDKSATFLVNKLDMRSSPKDGVYELAILPTNKVKIQLNKKSNSIEKFRYIWGVEHRDEFEDIDPEDIIHFYFPSPEPCPEGISPLEAGLKAIISDTAITDWWKNSIENGFKKDGIISYDHDLTPEQTRVIRLLMQEQVYGPQNSGGFLVLGHNAEYTPLDRTPAELDFIDSRKFTKEEICAILGVPVPLIGSFADADAQKIEEIRQYFWQEIVFIRVMDNLCATLNFSLLPEFLSGVALKKREIVYDVSTVEALIPYYGEKVKIIKDLVEAGYPLNAACRRLYMNLSDVDGGDLGYIQGNMMPLGDVHMRFIQGGAGPDDVANSSGNKLPNANLPKKEPVTPPLK